MPNTFMMTDARVHPLEGNTTAATVVITIAIKAILAIRPVTENVVVVVIDIIVIAILAIRPVTEDVVVVVIDILVTEMVIIATKVPILGTITIGTITTGEKSSVTTVSPQATSGGIAEKEQGTLKKERNDNQIFKPQTNCNKTRVFKRGG